METTVKEEVKNKLNSKRQYCYDEILNHFYVCLSTSY